MRQVNDMEKLFARISVPEVVTGEHRIRLKHQLVSQWHERATRVGIWRSLVSTPRRKVAFACCLALAIAAGAWAGQKTIRKIFTFEFEVEKVSKKLTSQDGQTINYESVRTVQMASDDPNLTEEDAKNRYEKMIEAIATGNARLVKTVKSKSGQLCYVYEGKLPDGERFSLATGTKIGGSKKEELDEEMEKAIAEDKGELVETIETESGDKVYIYKVVLSDGTIRTYGSGTTPEQKSERSKQ